MKPIPTFRVPLAGLASRDAWPLSSGELAVRSGMYQRKTPSNGLYVGGFSVHNPRTNEVWFYLVTQDSSNLIVTITTYDQDWVVVDSIQTNTTSAVQAVNLTAVEDQMMVSSPNFTTLWAVVGTPLLKAEKTASAVPGRVTLDVPCGLSVGWAARAVIAGSNALYISDALQPRTFDPENVLNPPGGNIFGVTVSAGGALVISTTDGVWALPEDAANSPRVYGVWSKLSDYNCFQHRNVSNIHGALYGLTSQGYRRIDQQGSEEIHLGEPSAVPASALFPPVACDDFRRGSIFAGQYGPVVGIESHMNVTHLSAGVKSWWRIPKASGAAGTHRVVGVMSDADGTDMVVLPTGVYRPEGSVDTRVDTGGSIGSSSVTGAVLGPIPTRPEFSNVIRWADFGTDGTVMTIAVGNGTKSVLVPQVAPVTGTDSWGTLYQNARLRSRRVNFVERTDEIVMFASIRGPGDRFGPGFDVHCAGPGRKRRTG